MMKYKESTALVLLHLLLPLHFCSIGWLRRQVAVDRMGIFARASAQLLQFWAILNDQLVLRIHSMLKVF